MKSGEDQYRVLERNISLRRDYYLLLSNVHRYEALRRLASLYSLSVKQVSLILNKMKRSA